MLNAKLTTVLLTLTFITLLTLCFYSPTRRIETSKKISVKLNSRLQCPKEIRTTTEPIEVSRSTKFTRTIICERLAIALKNKTGLSIGDFSLELWNRLKIFEAIAGLDVTIFNAERFFYSQFTDGSLVIRKNRTLGRFYFHKDLKFSRFPDSSYDFILVTNILEDLDDPFGILVQWLRLLRPTGILIIILPFEEIISNHQNTNIELKTLIDRYEKDSTTRSSSRINRTERSNDSGMANAFRLLEKVRRHSLVPLRDLAEHRRLYSQNLLYEMFRCLSLNVERQYYWDNKQMILGQKKANL